MDYCNYLVRLGYKRMIKEILTALLMLAFVFDADARTQRSYKARAEFKRLNFCPVTGSPRGPCPGYEIDHKIPLKCGGADSPSNMQWMTIEEHREKTSRESGWCLK